MRPSFHYHYFTPFLPSYHPTFLRLSLLPSTQSIFSPSFRSFFSLSELTFCFFLSSASPFPPPSFTLRSFPPSLTYCPVFLPHFFLSITSEYPNLSCSVFFIPSCPIFLFFPRPPSCSHFTNLSSFHLFFHLLSFYTYMNSFSPSFSLAFTIFNVFAFLRFISLYPYYTPLSSVLLFFV